MQPLAGIISAPIASSSNSWLITPNVGLTIWTLVVFAICLFILSKVAFPRIRKALDDRRLTISESIDAAQRTREEAERLLAEYRERLAEARQQAEQIVQRARQTAEAHAHEAQADVEARRQHLLEQTRREIEAETRRSIGQIRREVADLTVMATEKVTRRALTEEDQKRLVEDALAELDFETLTGGVR